MTGDSPCIDAADGANSPEVDIDGELRPYGGAADMGCDEHLAGGTGDECTEARIVRCGSARIHVDTTGFNDEAPSSSLCGHSGADIWYRMDTAGLELGSIVQATLSNEQDNDFHVGFLWGCDPNLSCIMTDTERVSAVYTTGDLYVLVDGGEGVFDLKISCCAVSGDVNVPADFTLIQDAVDAVCDGNTVWLEDGTYTGAGNRDIDFKGKEITLRSLSDDPELCIIDCQGSGRGFIFNSGETSESVVRGLSVINGSMPYSGGIHCEFGSPTITNCKISNCAATMFSAGLSCFAASPVISDCIISDNTAAYYAGGLACYMNSAPTITDSTFTGNYGGAGGGGLACYSSSPNIVRCVVSDNILSSGSSGGAGIALFDHSSPTIQDCTISANSCDDSGGGIECFEYCSPMISGCTITGNTADEGGGLFCDDNSSPGVTDSVFSQNFAADDGGGIKCRNSSSPEIFRCSILMNSAIDGAGVFSEESSPLLINCLIADNYAENCSGLCLGLAPSADIADCTVADNQAEEGCGGICFYGIDEAVVVNTILWGNDAPTAPELAAFESTILTLSYSDLQGGQEAVLLDEFSTLNWGEGMLEADPLFIGGAPFDYHLSSSSPCIDAGTDDQTTYPFLPEDDIDGEERPYLDSDIGCDEYVPKPVPALHTVGLLLLIFTFSRCFLKRNRRN